MNRKCVICGKELTLKKQKFTCGSYECHRIRMREVKRLRKEGKDLSSLGNFNITEPRNVFIKANLNVLFNEKLSAQEKARRLNIDNFNTLSYYFYKYRKEYPEYKDCKLHISPTDTDSPIYKQYKEKEANSRAKKKLAKAKARAKPKYEDHKAKQLLEKMKRGEL